MGKGRIVAVARSDFGRVTESFWEEEFQNVEELLLDRGVAVTCKRAAFSSFREKRQADFGDFSEAL
jgi:hypothetical protein